MTENDKALVERLLEHRAAPFSAKVNKTMREAADRIEALAAENERLREALRGMIAYASYSERWQDAHPEYVRAARAALGETQ